MKTLLELKQRRDELLAQAHELIEGADTEERVLSADEQAKYDAAVANIDQLNVQIARMEKLEELAKPAFTDKKRREGNDGGSHPDGEQDALLAPAKMLGRGDRATVIDGEDAVRIELMRPRGKMLGFENNREGREQAYRAGMWAAAVIYGSSRAADWCRRNGVRGALGTNTAGAGALVPDELERAIIALRETYGIFRPNCRVVPMSSDVLTTPRRVGGLTAYFVGENQDGTESDASWDNVTLTAKKLMCLTRMSSEISEDAIIDLASTLAQECGYAFAYKEDLCGFNGDGTSTYGGIVGVLVKALQAAHSKAKVAAASGHDQFAELDADDILALMAAVPQYAKAGSAWYCSPTAQELVFNAIKIAGGGNTRDMLAQADVPRFLGYPIHVTPVMNDVTTALNGLVMLGFGNLSMAASLGDRRGIRIALTDSRYWEADQIGLKATERFDINAHDMGSTTAKSPFAVLVGTT